MEPTSASPRDAPCAWGRFRVLVVEDELLIRLMLSEELRDAGFDIIEAFNADEAVVVLSSMTPDLIITDVRMPGSLDGVGLLALIRETSPTLPVIITSAHMQPTIAISDGATQFLAKPYAFETVVNAVKNELANLQRISIPAPSQTLLQS